MMFPFFKEATSNLFSKPSTENFPAVNVEAKPKYRGRIAYDADKCVNCGACVKVCAPIAITRTFEDLGDGTEKGTYHFDLTSCTFCGTCQDFCSTGAIQLTEDYHMVGNREDLFTEGTWIHKIVTGRLFCGDDCIFCGLCMRNCPEEAITVDRKTKTWKVDHELCCRCGICQSKCPKKCLEFLEDEEYEAAAKAKAEAQAEAAKAAAEAAEKEAAEKAAAAKAAEAAKGSEGAAKEAAPEKAAPASENAGAELERNAGAEDGQLICGESCVYCGLCMKNCPVEAITVDRKEKKWAVDRDTCVQCGLCISKCPKKCLSFKGDVSSAED